MAQALQFLDPDVSAPQDKWVLSTSHFAIPLTVGTNFKAGDLRIIFAQCTDSSGSGTNGSWISSTGWTRVTPTGSHIYPVDVVFYRFLQAGDADGVAIGGGIKIAGWMLASVTVRNVDPAQSLSFSSTAITAGNSLTPLNFSAPSQSVIAGSVLLCAFLSFSNTVSQTPTKWMLSMGTMFGATGVCWRSRRQPRMVASRMPRRSMWSHERRYLGMPPS